MSQAYPLMLGTAPLLVALVTMFQSGDALSLIAWIFSMILGSTFNHRKGIYLALLNALVIAGYTLIDGFGVRRSGAPAASVRLLLTDWRCGR